MIVAMTPKGVIGNKGTMPWARLRRDMYRFKQLTIPSAVVMGPKTYQSLPPKYRPLERRLNLVITTNRQYKPEKDVLVAHDPRQARERAGSHGYEELFVIGGAHVYTSFMDMAEHLYITYVGAELQGDTHFPHWDDSEWHKVSKEEKWKMWPGDTYPTRFAEYRRNQKPAPQTGQANWNLPEDIVAKK
jgi:dihydrofolate reductase